MIIEINGTQIVAELNDSSLDQLAVRSVDSLVLIEFNENLKKPADTEQNKRIKEFYARQLFDAGWVRIEDSSGQQHGRRHEYRLQQCTSQFEALAGVRRIKHIATDSTVFQYVSDSCSLRTAFEKLHDVSVQDLKFVVAIASSARPGDIRSCVAIMVCRENDPLMQLQRMPLCTELERTYKKWNYYFVSDIAELVQDLLNQHGAACRGFLTPSNRPLESITLDAVVSWQSPVEPVTLFRFFDSMPSNSLVPEALEPALFAPNS